MHRASVLLCAALTFHSIAALAETICPTPQAARRRNGVANRTESCVDVQHLRNFFETYENPNNPGVKSPLRYNIRTLVDTGARDDIDPRVPIAIAGAETHFATDNVDTD